MKKIILLLCITIIHWAKAQDAVLTAMDVAHLKMVTNTAISEDGNKIAYQLLIPSDPTKENAPAKVHLYVYDIPSGESIPFVTHYNVGNVTFRPHHNSLTFTARREGDKATSLYEISLMGGEAQKIYEFQTSIADYHWHPDGQQLAFVAQQPTEEEKFSLPYQPEIYEENLKFNAAYMVDPGKQEGAQAVSLDAHVNKVLWNHDGSKLALSAAPTPLVDDYYTSQQIYIINSSDLSTIGKVDHKAKLEEFVWSPDGNNIAFIGGEDEHDPIAGRLLIAEANGGTPRIIHRDFKGSFDDIAWKDNASLLFLGSEGVFTTLGTITVNGKVDKIIDKGDIAFLNFSKASHHTMALAGSTGRHPYELYLLETGKKQAERKTNSNPWLENRLLGKQEVITYKARDGLEIQGILIHPVNAAGNTQYPLITVVHGGPESHYDNGWLTSYSSPGQMGAGQGYAVFYPNYRGSTGRGIEFAKSSQGDPAGKEFDDVVDGVDYLIAQKGIDASKVGVTGGSYGGYATGWLSTRYTERFAAGVMFVGISDNISKWGTSDIPEEMFLVHSRKRIWEDYEFFLRRSPIYYAGQAKTPLLIMAGKEDTRVDPGQSHELYRHIKTRTDTPVRLVLYPGEGHGNRNATARYDYSLRMMRWFNTYLKNTKSKIPETSISLEAEGME